MANPIPAVEAVTIAVFPASLWIADIFSPVGGCRRRGKETMQPGLAGLGPRVRAPGHQPPVTGPVT